MSIEYLLRKAMDAIFNFVKGTHIIVSREVFVALSSLILKIASAADR